jgi:hypothetical protein
MQIPEFLVGGLLCVNLRSSAENRPFGLCAWFPGAAFYRLKCIAFIGNGRGQDVYCGAFAQTDCRRWLIAAGVVHL